MGLKPDLVIVDDARKEAVVVDVAMPFEGTGTFAEARAAKERKYGHLKTLLRSRGYKRVEVDAFIVGPLGSWDPDNDPVLHKLAHALFIYAYTGPIRPRVSSPRGDHLIGGEDLIASSFAINFNCSYECNISYGNNVPTILHQFLKLGTRSEACFAGPTGCPSIALPLESPSENTRQRSPTDVVTISDDENMDDPPTPFITPPSSPCHSIIPSSIHTPPSTSALPSPLVPDAHLSPTPSIFHNLLHAAPFVPASLPPPLLTSPSPITPPPQSPSTLLLNSLPEVAQGETVPRLSSQHASHQDPTPAPAVDLDDLDATLRLPFYEDLVPFKDRVMGEPEWITFQKVISRWSTVIQGLTATQQHRPSNPSAEWGKRRRRNKNGAQEPRDLEQPQNTTAEPPAVDDESGTRASGRARHAAKARFFQGLYKRNPADLAPPPSWLYRHDTQGVSGDVLAEPFTPQETIIQLKRAKKSAPGVDRITYGTWRWVDPLGLILSTIFNICRVNSRVPSDWKHATVTLIHKGAQKGFLVFDGFVEHNFLLQALLTDSRRSKRDLMLAWLDLRDAFGSVPHELLMLMMGRLGLSGGKIETVRDIYDHSSVAIKTAVLQCLPRFLFSRDIEALSWQ
eukprot:Em0007g1145a